MSYTGSTRVSVIRRTKFVKSYFLSRVSRWKVLEKMTIVSKKFDIYMVSRFDWSISILFSLVGTYASIGINAIKGTMGAGNSFTMSHSATRGSSWPYMDFNCCCDVSSGEWCYAHIWHMSGVYPYMGTPQSCGLFGGLRCVSPYYCCMYTHRHFFRPKCIFHHITS